MNKYSFRYDFDPSPVIYFLAPSLSQRSESNHFFLFDFIDEAFIDSQLIFNLLNINFIMK